MKIAAALSPLQARWRAFDQREQTLIRTAIFLLSLALVWLLLVAPPMRTLRQADTEQRSLDLQWQKMQGLQAQARALQSQPKLSRDDALRALEASVKQRLGSSGLLSVVGDRASVTLRNTPAETLAKCLIEIRVNARAIPSEARLVRNNTSPAGPPAWDGTLVLSLPAQ